MPGSKSSYSAIFFWRLRYSGQRDTLRLRLGCSFNLFSPIIRRFMYCLILSRLLMTASIASSPNNTRYQYVIKSKLTYQKHRNHLTLSKMVNGVIRTPIKLGNLSARILLQFSIFSILDARLIFSFILLSCFIFLHSLNKNF